jgi:hypothetical protein
MNKERENLDFHLNLKITNKMFQSIDTIRSEFLLENKRLPSRSEMIRILLEEAIVRKMSI